MDNNWRLVIKLESFKRVINNKEGDNYLCLWSTEQLGQIHET